MFFIYVFTGYIVYKTILNVRDIDEYLKYFIYVCAIYGLIIIFRIITTGILRSSGLNGPTFPDIIVCALLVAIFKYLFLERSKSIYVGIAIVLLIILVAGQSRFSWIGFLISFLYGLAITISYQKNHVLKRRMVYVLSTIVFGILIVFISGLYKVIIFRFSDVSLSVLQASDQKELVSNTLDTRALVWLTALNAFLHNLLTGVGYFMFYAVSENYNILPEFLYREIVMGLDAHSTLMNFLCETGLIGFTSILFFFSVIFSISFKAIKISKSSSDLSRSIALNILVFFIITTSIYSGAFTFGYNGYFLYFVFALVVANYVELRRNLKINL
jgi:O-antigen ligase